MNAVCSFDAALLDALDAAVLDALDLPDPVDVGGGTHAPHAATARYAARRQHPGRAEWAYPLDGANGPIVASLLASDARFAGLATTTLTADWFPPVQVP